MSEDGKKEPGPSIRGIIEEKIHKAKDFYTVSKIIIYRRIRQVTDRTIGILTSGTELSLRVVKMSAFYVAVCMLVILCVACVLAVCFGLSVSSTVAFRYYMLSNVPGNYLVPLSFNAMPLHTEWWRGKRIDDSIAAALSDRPHQAAPDASGYRELASTSDTALRAQYVDYKISFLKAYSDTLLATSTLPISTGTSDELFLPGGGINLEALFQHPTSLFKAHGEYSAQVQLVFLKEKAGRDVSLVVESAMLFAEDDRAPQALSSLDVLFRTTNTAYVRTGEPQLAWPLQALKSLGRMCFYVPISLYEYLQRQAEDSRSAPFAPIDHDTEVSVVVDIYKNFVPPASIQSRMRALNFTVYQNLPDAGDVSKKAKLRRLALHSSVLLTGLPHLLTTYPITSFLFLTFGFFIMFSSIGFVVLIGAAVAIYINFFRSLEGSELEYGNSASWESPTAYRKMNTNSGRRAARTYVDPYRPSPIEVYELERSQSASFFPVESMSSIGDHYDEDGKKRQ